MLTVVNIQIHFTLVVSDWIFGYNIFSSQCKYILNLIIASRRDLDFVDAILLPFTSTKEHEMSSDFETLCDLGLY